MRVSFIFRVLLLERCNGTIGRDRAPVSSLRSISISSFFISNVVSFLYSENDESSRKVKQQGSCKIE